LLASQIVDAPLRAFVERHLHDGYPLVVRRQSDDCCVSSGLHGHDALTERSIAAGLPLPPAHRKARLAFSVPCDAIVQTAPPLLLAEAVPRLPDLWRAPLAELARRGERSGIALRVYGSVSWQALTGSAYLTATSDVDVLWQPQSETQLAAGVALLEDWETCSGLMADGEIQFGNDAAVAWREWRNMLTARARSRIIVKSFRGVRISTHAELLALMAPPANPTQRQLATV
jgi:phosphoribosyl-dephospho-CoA transferase